MYRQVGKRSIDVLVAAIGLLVSLPLTVTVTVWLWRVNGGQPFFVQPRPGLHGKVFRLLKFKTMTDERGPDGHLLPDADRLTSAGRFVRKTSMDELPQLWHVLTGEMSLIGPRPLLVEYLPLYSPEQARRHEVRPGITGWAQVNGRNTLSWEQKFTYDVWYVDNLSPTLDFRIIWLTISKVFRSEGISSTTSATMEKFTGSTESIIHPPSPNSTV
jgi:undecaprenyl phosphate N,N'-diacetylbacillosamine 1-phosphate transferase